MHINKKVILYLFLFFLLLFSVFQYGITKIVGFSLFPDEFGYWASAANALGWDWSETASLGSYYSYGYSVLLIPLLILFKNSVAAYRAAIVVNMLLMILAYFLLLKIKHSIQMGQSKQKDMLLCMTAIFYPSWIFYMQMTMTEALLMFLFVLLVFLYTSILEKSNIIRNILLALVLAYLYMVHMRTIGVVIACVVVMIILAIVKPEYRKSTLAFLGVLLFWGIMGEIIKSNTIQNVYSHADSSLVSLNDYSSKWWIFKELLTLEVIRDLLISLLGKVFYLGMASFGVFFWAFYWTVKKTCQLFHKIFRNNRTENQEWLGFFLLLAMLGEVFICAIGMCRSGYADGLIYGRYSEFLMPVYMIIGMKQLEESGKLFLKTGIVAVVTGGCIPILLWVINSKDLTVMRGYHAVGISYLLDESQNNMTEYLFKAWLFAAIIMFVISIVIFLSKNIRNMEWILCCIVLIELGLGMHAANHYVYPSNTLNYTDIVITDTICENLNENESILYIYSRKNPLIDFIQMQLREHSLHITSKENTNLLNQIMEADYLIVDNGIESDIEYESYFERQISSDRYTLYYGTEEEH